jgi:hypothetical protein
MARRLESIVVFLVEDSNGDEGVAAFPQRTSKNSVVLQPMIANTEERLEQLRDAARDLVAGQRMRIVRFGTREDLEEFVSGAVKDRK